MLTRRELVAQKRKELHEQRRLQKQQQQQLTPFTQTLEQLAQQFDPSPQSSEERLREKNEALIRAFQSAWQLQKHHIETLETSRDQMVRERENVISELKQELQTRVMEFELEQRRVRMEFVTKLRQEIKARQSAVSQECKGRLDTLIRIGNEETAVHHQRTMEAATRLRQFIRPHANSELVAEAKQLLDIYNATLPRQHSFKHSHVERKQMRLRQQRYRQQKRQKIN